MSAHTMRIALVTPRYAPSIGGVETHVTRVATYLAARGHVVEVLTHAHRRGLALCEEVEGVTVRRFPLPLPTQSPLLAFAPGLWAYLVRHAARYDVVHAHHYHALPALGAALSGCRSLVFTPHYHGAGHTPLRSLLHVPYRHAGARVFARAHRVICNSEAEAALVRRDFPCVARRMDVIYPGVDVAAVRAAVPYTTTDKVILSVGRLETYKNVQLVIAMLRHLDDGYVLRVIGDGPARTALEQVARRLGLGRRVEFLGRVDDDTARRWLRTARVYVSMSAHEAFGLALVEALAAGTPALVADIPAYREIARGMPDGAVALAPLASTPAELASALRALVSYASPDVSAYSIASWDDVAARTEAVYDALLRGRV
jgi:glycosyltransferase involved in cell wall biosynthesis